MLGKGINWTYLGFYRTTRDFMISSRKTMGFDEPIMGLSIKLVSLGRSMDHRPS
jgi:hypothetical protein